MPVLTEQEQVKKSSFLNSLLHGLLAGTLFGLWETLLLASHYRGLDAGAFFVAKVLLMYWVWGVIVTSALKAYDLLPLPSKFRVQLPTDIYTLLFYSLAACFLIIDADFFYFRMNPAIASILVLLFFVFVTVGRVVSIAFKSLSRKVQRIIPVIYILISLLAITSFLQVKPQSKQASRLNTAVEEGGSSLKKQPNILFVLVDALDTAHISYLGYFRQTTPHIDQLAEKGVAFSKFYTPYSTASSVSSMFLGFKPKTLKLNYVDDIIESKYFTLGELMEKAGYQTSAFSWTHYIDSMFGFGQGMHSFENLSRVDPAGYAILKRGLWHTYKNHFPFRQPFQQLELALAKLYDPKQDVQSELTEMVQEQGVPEIEALDVDEKMLNLFSNWLEKKTPAPFFAFLHLQGAHSPYVVPKSFQHRFFDEEKAADWGDAKTKEMLLGLPVESDDYDRLRTFYDTRLRFSDEIVGRLLQLLEDQGLMDNTLIIVLGDHGSQIAITEKELRSPAKRVMPPWEISEPHPFLLFYYPEKFAKKKIVDKRVLSIDLLPTFADIVSIDLPYEVEGTSFAKDLYQEA